MSDELLQCREWIVEFKKARGHAPSVLHIGNIANNAYNNAKLLNEIGFDCDVMCYDYYHIMGCPEWEDADFVGKIEDQFYPDWESVNLNGYRRPRWFAQGPRSRCISYLVARRSKSRLLASLYWLHLKKLRSYICRHGEKASRRFVMKERVKAIVNALTRSLTLGALATKFVSSSKEEQEMALCCMQRRIDHRRQIIRSKGFSPFCGAALGLLLKHVLLITLHKILSLVFRKSKQVTVVESPGYSSQTLDRCTELASVFSKGFPNRKEQIRVADLLENADGIKEWQRLFSCYDIIQAYSTDPLIPLLANVPYLAFEHGTLREIPFENSSRGRMTALSYHLAEHVFVTNADCLENAHHLAGDRVTFINHPFDEDHSLTVGSGEKERTYYLDSVDADFLFFFPTRHDWVPGTGYADKANDIFLKAFCMLRKKGHRVGIVCCRWGANVEESLDLLKAEGCDRHVIWEEPMGTVRFELTVKASDVVVDQFRLGSFGGVMFKAMAVGKPICTYLNEEEIVSRYQEMPPIINCRSETEIVERMTVLMRESDELKRMGLKSREWIKKHHASETTVAAQVNVFKKYLDNARRDRISHD